MCLGQNVQPLQLRQKERVVLIVRVLDPAVLLHPGRIGQVNRIAQARRPSTSQYQLYVDSTATLPSCSLNGARNSLYLFKSQSSFRCLSLRPLSIHVPIITLLLCRSIPANLLFLDWSPFS